MYRPTLILLIALPLRCAEVRAEEPPATLPGFNQRLNEALGSESGVQVYQDADGSVGTIIDLPGGERRVTVQPPQSPSINLGPPLQLPPSRSLPPPVPEPPATQAPDFPRRAR